MSITKIAAVVSLLMVGCSDYEPTKTRTSSNSPTITAEQMRDLKLVGLLGVEMGNVARVKAKIVSTEEIGVKSPYETLLHVIEIDGKTPNSTIRLPYTLAASIKEPETGAPFESFVSESVLFTGWNASSHPDFKPAFHSMSHFGPRFDLLIHAIAD